MNYDDFLHSKQKNRRRRIIRSSQVCLIFWTGPVMLYDL